MRSIRQLTPPLQRVWLLALPLMVCLPTAALAQEDAAEPGGGMMKTLLGYVLVLLGVGLGIAAVVYPSNSEAGKKSEKK